jgi:hypothetical protein
MTDSRPIPKFSSMTVEETQEYFSKFRKKKTALRKREFDLDVEFSKILTVVSREIDKLMDLSNKSDALDSKNHEATIAYAKLVGGLKKQMHEAIANANPEEIEKLADEDRG